MERYPGYALVRRLMSRRRPIFEAIEHREPWRHVALALRGRGASAADDLATMAAAAGRLEHAGISPLVATHADALAFGWAGGRRLDRAGPPVGAADRLELAIQIAELVAHAHQREVVLRDLKPSNLLLDRRDGRLHVTLVDLDLARIEGTDRRAASEATGTWGWSAPEQAALEPRWVDRRSDLYALGTTLAFVLSGTPVFSRGARAVREQLTEDRLAGPFAASVIPPVLAILRALIAVDRDARRPASEIVGALRSLRGEQHSAAALVLPGPRRGDAVYAAFRATVAAMQDDAPRDPIAVARVALRLGAREVVDRCASAAPVDHAGMRAIVARAQLERDEQAAARATLDQITALPADRDDAHDVLAAEVAALRPRRALELAGSDRAARAILRERCAAWLAQLDALSWHERLAWQASQPDGDAVVRAMTATATALGAPQLEARNAAPHEAAIAAVIAAPRARAAWLTCAERLLAGGRIADALEVLASCELACGHDPAADRLRAHAWLAIDEAELAIDAGRRALRGGNAQPALWHTLALAWIRTGNAADAHNAIEMLVRTGDHAARAATLAFYASLVVDATAADRLALADAARAVHPDDADLIVMRALVQVASGAATDAEPALAALCAARPDLVLTRAAELTLRGMTPALHAALEPALGHTVALDWAAAHYYLAAEQPLTAAMFVRDHADRFPALAADAFLQAGDGESLRALAPRLPDLAERLAYRAR